jgi:DNA-binding NarL/FixJ family response regulator
MVVMIRVLIVNEIDLLCNVLSTVLEDEPDMDVIGFANTAEVAVKLARNADVVLVNTKPAGGIALELMRSIGNAGVPAKIIALGLTDSPEQVVRFIQEGASGYVLEDHSVDELLEQIREVHNGQVNMSPRIAAAVMARVTEYAQMLAYVEGGDGDPARLTSREREIVELIGQNLTNQQIAERLIIELGTVKNHVHNILHKLAASSRQEAAANWAVKKRKPAVTTGPAEDESRLVQFN